jgi:hypothetical protein
MDAMNTAKSAAMFARVDEWRQSGKSLREFATTIGMTKSAFEYWVRKKRSSLNKPSAFIELVTETRPMEAIGDLDVPRRSTPRQASIVITFPGGMSVNIYG